MRAMRPAAGLEKSGSNMAQVYALDSQGDIGDTDFIAPEGGDRQSGGVIP